MDGSSSEGIDATVSLGTEWVATENVMHEPTGWLGLRTKMTRTPVDFLDWTIDGLPLRSMLPLSEGRLPDERTRMVKDSEGESWAYASLSALLDGYDESSDDWVRYGTGRTAILYCPQCWDLGCPAITARIEFSESTVCWRDVGYETEFAEAPAFETFDRISLTFDRTQYEGTVQALLEIWGAAA